MCLAPNDAAASLAEATCSPFTFQFLHLCQRHPREVLLVSPCPTAWSQASSVCGLLLPGTRPCPAGSFSEDTAISRPAKVRTRCPRAMLWLVQRTALQFLLAALHKSSFSWAGEQRGVLTANSCSETCSTEADKTP